jgi:hypothetical protein
MLGLVSVPFRRLCIVMGALAAVQTVSSAQQIADPEPEPTNIRQASGFRLFGAGDYAATGMRVSGNADWWTANEGFVPCKAPGCPASLPSIPQGAFLFELQPWITAARSNWLRNRDLAPSLENARGGGWSAAMAFQRWTPEVQWQFSGKDGSVGILHSGAVSESGTGSCQDNSSLPNAFMSSGIPLLAASDCPPTWPNPAAGFEGQRLVADTTWLRRFNDDPMTFTFDDFKIPASERTDKIHGSFQTYGSVVDYGREVLQRFGPVVPGGQGEIRLEGYPFGIEFAFQAFTYAVPALSQVIFFKFLIINNSADVYGVPLNYDSLYIGVMPRPSFVTQAGGFYAVPERGAVFMSNPNVNSQNCYGGVHGANVTGGYTAGTNIRGCLSNTHGDRGMRRGAIATVTLKSPIGDLRNKKFSDPESPFYFPAHPNAGDTITFNQANACGFSCASDQFFAGNVQAAFGAYANVAVDALAGRGVTAGQLTELQYFDLFHNADWPLRFTGSGKQGDFNYYVPGHAGDGSSVWDYNHDGNPDTLFVGTCHVNGCVRAFTDTFPGGFPNRVHNAIHIGFGPFNLAAGDTAEWITAHTLEPDSLAVERAVNTIIETYQTFWLSAEPPSMPRVLSAEVTGGNRQFDTFIRMYIDEGINTQVDPFLIAQAKQLREATDPPSIDLKVRNPTLVNDIRARGLPRGTALRDTVPIDTSAATVAACSPGNYDPALCRIVTGTAIGVIDTIYVFKSCDNGLTWTNTSAFACTPAPARGVEGVIPGFPWQAYGIMTRGANGRFATQFTDGGVTGGLTYTYVFAAKSYPAVFSVLRGTPSGGVVSDSVVIRPAVANGLSTNTSNPNVAVVYVPASRQAGSVASRVDLLGTTTGDTTASFAVSFRLAKQIRGSSPIATELILSDRATVEVYDSDSTAAGIDSTVVTLYDLNRSGSLLNQVVSSRRFVVVDSDFRVDAAGLFVLSSDTLPQGGTSRITTYAFNPGVQATLVSDGRPFFVTDSLGAQWTPDRTIARADYHGLVVNYSTGTARTLNSGSTRWVVPGVGVLSTNANPNVAWRSAQSTARHDHAFSQYKIDFDATEFGPGAPFTLNFNDPGALQTALDASLAARGTVGTTVADQATADLLNATLPGSLSLTADSLAVLSLPFRITNGRTGEEVRIAVRKSEHPNTLLFGISTDTIRVNAPQDKWVPGDRLYLIETVRELVKNSAGQDTIILNGGVPDSADFQRVTWGPTVLGCDVPAGTFTCNPVSGRGGSGYTAVHPNAIYQVIYFAPLGNLVGIDMNLMPDIAGSDIATLSEGDLSLVNVAPNPYVMFSQYEQVDNVKRLMFTGLPARGTLRIYTASGQFVQQLIWTEADLERNCTATTSTSACQSTGDLAWNMRTREDLELGPGFYIFVVSTDIGGSKKEKLGKFVIIH